MTKSTIKEELARVEHERWADWQKYLHSKCVQMPDSSLIIPAASVRHWERQIETPYDELTDREQDSDREQVERYWPIIAPYLEQALKDEAMEKTQHRARPD